MLPSLLCLDYDNDNEAQNLIKHICYFLWDWRLKTADQVKYQDQKFDNKNDQLSRSNNDWSKEENEETRCNDKKVRKIDEKNIE